jgi:protein involved in polysaccharide export with SLBB domain
MHWRINIPALHKPARVLAFIVGVAVFVGMSGCMGAAQNPSQPVQTNSAAQGSNGPAGALTNLAAAKTSGLATNGPMSGASSDTSATNSAFSQAGGSKVVANPLPVAANASDGTNMLAGTKMVAATTRAAGTNVAGDANLVSAGTNGAADLDDKYKLVIGDRLSFQILEDEGKPEPLVVTDSGDLQVPYIRRVPAVGKTCKQLAAEIKTALDISNYYNSTVIIAVDLKNKPQHRVYIYGAVRLPGPVEMLNDEVLTLSQAIVRAGGPTDFANKDDIQVTRKSEEGKNGTKTFDVNLSEILKGKKEKDLPLQPDDLINVKEEKVHL